MFTLELLQAVNNWQLGGDPTAKAKRGKRLNALVATLPEAFKTCKTNCYRRLSLTKGSVWKVGTESELKETISSWTVSLQVAKEFKDGVPPKGYQGVIFEYCPKPVEVVVNLDALFLNRDFQIAIKEKKERIKNFDTGIGRYLNTQQEVVLSLPKIPLDAVHCWGGYIGNEKSFEGMLPAGQSMEDFKKLLANSAFDFNQPQWLCNPEAITHVNDVLAKSGQKLAADRASGLCT
jgi:hypothetical protein